MNSKPYFLFTGLSPFPSDVPSVHLLQSVLLRIRMVRTFPGETLLHASVQSIRMDSCRFADCRHSELPDHTEYL